MVPLQGNEVRWVIQMQKNEHLVTLYVILAKTRYLTAFMIRVHSATVIRIAAARSLLFS